MKCHCVILHFWHFCTFTTCVNVGHVILFSLCSISSSAHLHAAADASSESCDITLSAFWEETVNSSKDIWGVWAQYVTLLPSAREIWLQNAETSSMWASLLRDRVWWGWSMLKQSLPPLGIFNLTTFDMEQGKKFRQGLTKSTTAVKVMQQGLNRYFLSCRPLLTRALAIPPRPYNPNYSTFTGSCWEETICLLVLISHLCSSIRFVFVLY